jgi:hypothetical protein
MKTIWAFQVKDKHDGTLHYKSRVCSKGYEQIPGMDFTELFALVTMDTTVRTTLYIYLYFAQGRVGVTFFCEKDRYSCGIFGRRHGQSHIYQLATKNAGNGICNPGECRGILMRHLGSLRPTARI